MTGKSYLRFFMRTPTGIGALAAGLLTSLGCAAAGLGAFLSASLGLGATLALSALLLLIGAGPRAAAREAERLAMAKGRSALAAARDDLELLEAVRISDAEVAAARDAVALAAGLYLESASSSPDALRDPAAEAAIAEALDLLRAWLREADESSTERRLGLPDAHPFPEAKARVVAALRGKAGLLGRGRDLAEGIPPPPDRVAIDEELR